MHRLLAIALLITACWPILALADYDRGLAAYQRGDFTQAHSEWLDAAQQGMAQAQYRLADLYESGLGVNRDFLEATKWYRRAARQGHTISQHMIGLTYAYGLGVPRNMVEAYMWLDLAAASGDLNAGALRDSLARAMEPDQLADARKLSENWQPQQ
jgi:TPR repeat protein